MCGDENLRRRNTTEAGGEDSASLSEISRILVILDGDDDDDAELIGIAEETVAEVMRWLEREIASPPPLLPSINGNQEICGPSISDSASTVMASVDTNTCGGGGVSFFFGAPVDPVFPAAGIRAWIGGSVGNQGVDSGGGGADDEWLAMVLSEAVVELEDSSFSD